MPLSRKFRRARCWSFFGRHGKFTFRPDFDGDDMIVKTGAVQIRPERQFPVHCGYSAARLPGARPFRAGASGERQLRPELKYSAEAPVRMNRRFFLPRVNLCSNLSAL